MRCRSIGVGKYSGTPSRNWPSRLLKSCSGASAVEFAIVVQLLILILFGIITFGWMFYLENNMESAARAAARRMAVAEATGAGTNVTCASAQAQTPGTAENAACTMLPLSNPAHITVNAATLCPGERAVRVRVSAVGSDVALADIFGYFNGKTISSTVDMWKEAECS